MTESDWLAAADPVMMLDHLGKAASKRKVRLFAVACCRRVWAKLPAVSRAAVVAAEGYADGAVKRVDMDAASQAAAEVVDDSESTPAEFAARSASRPDLRAPWVAYLCAHTRYRHGRGSEAKREQAEADELATQTDLLRDVFGNPYRVVDFSAKWRTATAAGLAETMYQSRTFARMPLLADALQDVGCADEAILSHCRDADQLHVRGCWVVDLVLGKA